MAFPEVSVLAQATESLRIPRTGLALNCWARWDEHSKIWWWQQCHRQSLCLRRGTFLNKGRLPTLLPDFILTTQFTQPQIYMYIQTCIYTNINL